MDYHHLFTLSNKLLQNKIYFTFELIFSSVIGVTIVFPILGTLLLLNELLRNCYKFYLWIVYDNSVMLCEDDCSSNYVVIPPNERHTVLYLGEVEGTVDVTTVRDNYQKRVIENEAYSELKYIFEKGYLYCCKRKCENFDIKNHVRYYPGTEERTVSEQELMQEILPDLSRDMTDPNKPMWEEVIVPYFEKPSATLAENGANENGTENDVVAKAISLRIIRMHHCYMDGASTLIMIANCFTSEGDAFPYVIDPCKPLKISSLSKFLYKLTCLALFSATMIRNLILPPFLRTSRFKVNLNSRGKVMFGWTNKIPIDYFQSIKEKSGVSMPAIISSVLGSAIRNVELKYPVNEKNIINNNNKDIKTAAKVPSIHPLWLVAGMFPYQKNKPGNEHIVIETQVNTSEISGCERLALMNDYLGRLAKNPMVFCNYWFARIIGRTPIVLSELLLRLSSCPAILSNVPLCTRNVKLWGHECTGIVGWVPLLSDSGLGVVSVRYADHFRYCIQTDSSALNQEQLDYLIKQLELEVEELFLETASLKRKISTESSLFNHETDKQQLLSTQETISCDQAHSDADIKPVLASYKRNNNNGKETGFYIGGVLVSSNYSFIFKLKDSIDQIKDSIRKMKEE